MGDEINRYEDQVVAELEALGFQVLRNGWPDVLLLDAAGRCRMVAEIKTPQDQVRANQKQMLEALGRTGIPVRVITPTTLGDILKELRPRQRQRRGPRKPGPPEITERQMMEAVLRLPDWTKLSRQGDSEVLRQP